MIGKILSLPYSKIAKTVHGEMERSKRHSSPKKSDSNNDNKENNKEEKKEKSQDASLEASKEELTGLIKELNLLECYATNELHFDLSFEGRYYLVKLIDKNGHTLQEYLPAQFRALYSQIKTDNDDSRKGTILNLNC